MPAPSATSIQYEPANDSATATAAAPASATMITVRGPKRSTGRPPSGPNTAAGNDQESDSSAICAGPASNR